MQIEQYAKDKEKHQSDLDLRTNRIEEVTAALGNPDNMGQCLDLHMTAVPLQAELVERAWRSAFKRPIRSSAVDSSLQHG